MKSAGYAVFILSLVAVSVVTPLILSREKYRITWWDYAFPILGVPLWYVLQAVGIGDGVSMTNFILELFLILVVSISIPWIRFVLTFSNAGVVSNISFLLTFFPLIVAISLRLTVPLLPE